MLESFTQLFSETQNDRPLYVGALVKARVLYIGKDQVIVDARLKSEAWIPIQQFLDEEGELGIQVDDQVEVAIEALDDGFGETHLSREKAKRAVAWADLQEAFANKSTVHGIVTGKVKGGFTVDMGVLQGFLPGSLVDLRPVRDASFLEDKPSDFKVIKLDPRRNNIVLSRRAVLAAEGQVTRKLLLNQLAEKQVIKGIVKNLSDYGAFVDIGGMDGLLHNSDIAWKKVKHASEILSPGDEIEVTILKIDRERGRVSLGLKQLSGDDPWSDLVNRYPIGIRLTACKVTNITDYGCFAEIEPGVEGLVHVSAMDWTNRNVNPKDIIKNANSQNSDGLEPDVIEVMVLKIDVERRRISLGIKQCQENPWETFASQHSKGEVISGKIKSITNLGLFIGLSGDIDGLVHHSEIMGNLSGEEALRQYKKGDEVEAIILSIDAERERIALSIRQLDSADESLDIEGSHDDATETSDVGASDNTQA